MNGDLFERIGIINMLYSCEKYGISMKDVLENYNKLTEHDIKRVAEKYLPSSREEGSYILVIGKPMKKSDIS
jgi:hypothetical protein